MPSRSTCSPTRPTGLRCGSVARPRATHGTARRPSPAACRRRPALPQPPVASRSGCRACAWQPLRSTTSPMGGASGVLVAVVGATGTGKSALSLDLVENLAAHGMGAEIINADAMQLYRGMDIGTAKLPVAERRGIAHHMLDVLEPSHEASVAGYQVDARAAIEDVRG